MLDSVVPALAARPSGLFVVGICGAQGSGKSTIANALVDALAVPAAALSLDDLYLPRADRQALAQQVHPLFATRGVPGTHDPDLGLATIAALERGEPAPLPRFDKAADDRLPVAHWPKAPAGTRVLVLEGWCLGARPQPQAALADPLNALERDEDPDGIWRHAVNAALGGPGYRALFGRIDHLTLLAAPGWQAVLPWRTQQEQALRREGRGGMTDAQLARFVQHYERLTGHILAEMPAHADLVLQLDAARQVVGQRRNGAEFPLWPEQATAPSALSADPLAGPSGENQ
ncbi:kinase [Novosphingobium sp. HBC54]|uniref:Kinase n=1 Tax=Novosphingobium cyanobacteriorum TaxID=3024215 RepID=A0ABT6CMR9_9SPHN|nr:kinase [Novosphingobium cyanobacteriorum]MDF8335211.1 kinase [Novosphingobium cyanobacteriorum]